MQRPGRGRGRGAGRHPSHLKGRAIGLWYANQGGRKARSTEREYFEPNISLTQQKVCEIQTLLHEYHFILDGETTDSKHEESNKKFRQDFERAVSVDIEEQILLKIAEKRQSGSGSSADEPTPLDTFLLEEQSTAKETDLQAFRKKLPCWRKKDEIIKALHENQVLLIKGETGCGKTTQVTQYILDDAIARGCGSKVRIVCTQPRRISAITVAERVAAERGEALGKSTGYSIRLEGVYPRKEGGSIKYCTTGVLLKYLEDDAALFDYSHIILDEIHERDIHSDVALAILKRVRVKNFLLAFEIKYYFSADSTSK